MRGAWFAGDCQPIDPAGVGTYGFAVRQAEDLLERQSGRVPPIAGLAMTRLVAEYAALYSLLRWLHDHPGDAVRIEGDSKAVVMQVRGEWLPPAPLASVQGRCAELVAGLPQGSRLIHIGRARNAEAVALARLAYVASFEEEPALRDEYADQLASPYQLEQLRLGGHPVHAYLGRIAAERLLRRGPP